MRFRISYQSYPLKFRFDAGTSRGVLKEHIAHYIRIEDTQTGQIGIGEASPLKGLSPDDLPDFAVILRSKLVELKALLPDLERTGVDATLDKLNLIGLPALRFGIETALTHLSHGTVAPEFDLIKINGLVWMGDAELMRERMAEKIEAGFSCVKMKIGAIDIDAELDLLRVLRKEFDASQVELRVDANGAFDAGSVMEVMRQLMELDIHSIEQPVHTMHWDLMKSVIDADMVDVALDEELIGRGSEDQQKALLDYLEPHFIVLKPTLLGGIAKTRKWIDLATERNVGWWVTSALESNVGLARIASFVSQYDLDMPQGLGTGGLYHNNLESPLVIEGDNLQYNTDQKWNFDLLESTWRHI